MSGTTYIRVSCLDCDKIRDNKIFLNKLSIESNDANDYLHININKKYHRSEIEKLRQLNFSISFEVYNDDNKYCYSYVLDFKYKKLIKINTYSSRYDSCTVHWNTRESAIDLITSEKLDSEYRIDLICSPNDGSNKIVNMTVEAINLINL